MPKGFDSLSPKATLVGMRIWLLLIFVFAFAANTGVAEAELFGGFANGGSYRRGTDQLCQPVASKLAVTQCHKKTVAELAALDLDKGQVQAGTERLVSAKKKGTSIELHSEKGSIAVWDSGQILGDIGAVHLDKSHRWVAVEFKSRFGGRQVDDLVVMTLAKPLQGAATTIPGPVLPSKVAAPSAEDPAEFSKRMQQGLKWAKRRKHKKAISSFQAALTVVPEHPEALYRLARSHMASKDSRGAIAALARIVLSSHSAVARWRVEARFDIVFKSLRGDTDFRRAVGIERAAGDKATLYERLIAFGGGWEQESIACEQPMVSLNLQRNRKRRFDLIIRSKCQGSTETTRLDGSWRAKEPNRVGLTFPNTASVDEDLLCSLELCADDSGEDCLRCQLGEDLEFLLRVVRR